MIDPKDVERVVGRKLRGLPLSDDEPQIAVAPDGRRMCLDCGRRPVAEKGSTAHEQGLCVECAAWKRRHGDWDTPPIPGMENG